MNFVLKRSLKVLAASLRDFGYQDVTLETVEDAHANWKAGKEPVDYMASVCVRVFEMHWLLFGKPEQPKNLQTS